MVVLLAVIIALATVVEPPNGLVVVPLAAVTVLPGAELACGEALKAPELAVDVLKAE